MANPEHLAKLNEGVQACASSSLKSLQTSTPLTSPAKICRTPTCALRISNTPSCAVLIFIRPT